jgi:hypothetical protein
MAIWLAADTSSAASSSSSSEASAQVRLPSRIPRMMGSLSLKGDENRLPKPVSLPRQLMPFEPSPKLSEGANAKEVMDESKCVLGVLMFVDSLSLTPLPFQFLFKIDIFYRRVGTPPAAARRHSKKRVGEGGTPLVTSASNFI